MGEARSKSEWNQTASMMAIIASIMHDPKKGKAPTPEDFHPFLRKGNHRVTKQKAPLSVLRDIFCKKEDK